MAKRRRKTRTHLKDPNLGQDASTASAPKSFIIKAGNVGRSVSTLVQDTRKVMEPNTASKLRERKSNRLRDFLTMAGPLGVTHMMIFGQTDAGTNLRIARCPRGPTVTFRVNKYALAKDVQASSRRPKSPSASDFLTPPLLVLNNFGGEERYVKLLVATFQNLFPPIQVHSMKLTQARRIVLLNYNASTKTIDWRHYLISVRPVGVSKSVRRVIEGTTRSSFASNGSVSSKRKGRSLVNLADASDIADYVLGRTSTPSASLSGASEGGFETDASEAESEAEDMADPKMKVELHEDYVGRGNVANAQRAVRLKEIGPRMELKLIKVVEGLNEGAVLYHDYLTKSATEAKQSREVEEKKRLAKQRREEQERNVERKKKEKEEARKEARRAQKLRDGILDVSDNEDDEKTIAAGPQQDEDVEEDDEFEYEDRIAEDDEGLDEVMFDEGDDSDLHVDSDEEEEEDDDDDDSDLEPIPLGDVQHDHNTDDSFEEYDDEDDVDEEIFEDATVTASKKRKVGGAASKGKGAPAPSKGKGKAKGKARR